MNLLQRIRLWWDFRRVAKRAKARAYLQTGAGRELAERLQRFAEISTRTGLTADDLSNWRPELPRREPS